MKNFPRELRTLQFVPRWSIVRTLRTQSVAEHSYYVALYCRWIFHSICEVPWMAENGVELDGVLKAALTHDIEESFTSDIPNPIKGYAGLRGNEAFKKWESETAAARFGGLFYSDPPKPIKQIVWLADVIEACAFLAEERRMGNREVDDILDHMMEILDDVVKSEWFKDMSGGDPESARAVFDHINDIEFKCDTVTK